MKDMKKLEKFSDDQFSTTKYVIRISYEIKGIVSTMDIIGGLFGQTEGLLNDLELRELQKSGRIGRIQVQNTSEKGRSIGQVLIPSSLDRVETAILAATIESVDRVGPCSAVMRLEEIQDIREDKRKQIMDRAQELLQKWEQDTPESAEMSESILDKIRTGELVHYGPEKLAAGEDVEDSPQIIIVEGVADVKTMMRAGFKNSIATNGTQIPKTIIDLTKKKSTIAFVDGDRGGEMILNELIQVADLDYIAQAPKGLMVEELTRKQIIKHIQAKKTIQEYLAEKERDNKQKSTPKKSQRDYNRRQDKRSSSYKNRRDYRNKNKYGMRNQKSKSRKKRSHRNAPRQEKISVDPKILDQMKSIIASNEAVGLNESNEPIFRVGNTQVFTAIESADNNLKTLLLDGVVTQRLLDKATEKKIDKIFAVNYANNLDKKQVKIGLFKNYIQ